MRKSKWIAVKILLENYKSEGYEERYIASKVAKEMGMTRQNIYHYIKKNKFKFNEANTR